MSDETTELQGIMDEFEHECYMLRVEASETRARDDVVRRSYERMRDEFAGRIAATLGNEREKALEELVRDLIPFVCADDGIEDIEARMRALGLTEVD